MQLFDILLLLAGSQGLLLGIALLFSGKRDKANPFLGIFVLVLALELLNAWAMSIRYHSSAHALPFWLLGSYLLLPASLWCYFEISITQRLKLKRYSTFYFLPALIEILAELFSFALHRHNGSSLFLSKYTGWFLFTEVMPLIASVSILIFWGSTLSAHKHQYNPTSFIRLVVFFSIFSLLTILWSVETIFLISIFEYIEIFLVLLLIALSYVAYFKPSFFEEIQRRSLRKNENVYANKNVGAEWSTLKKKFEEDKIYRQSKLTINTLSRETGLPTRFITYLIKKQTGLTFNTFVNTCRVNEVMDRLKDPKQKHKTLLAIALESGFNSKSSFNQTFKELNGKTPSDFLSENSL